MEETLSELHYKLALIRQSYRPDGGAERILERLLNGFKVHSSVDVTLFTQNWANAPSTDDVAYNVFKCPKRGWFRHQRFQYFVDDVQRCLGTQSFHLVQSHERIPGCHLYRAGDGVHAAWLEVYKSQINHLQRFWQRYDPFHKSVLQAERQLFYHPNLRKVICISEQGRREILRHYPEVDPDKLEVIYNGINLQEFLPTSEKSVSANKIQVQYPELVKFGLTGNRLTALFVGSGFERKGLKQALDALTKLENWQLVIVGRDHRQQYYQKYAEKLGIQERVFFAGIQQDVRPWYYVADILIHPALYEPFGNVVLEAMACGLPVLVSNQCGSADLVESDFNGFVTEAGSVDGLAEKLGSVRNRDHLAILGKHAREKAEDYSVERMVGRFLEIYQGLLK
ncbi:MAG: glycosyltransferase family 4 protein [bacterium]